MGKKKFTPEVLASIQVDYLEKVKKYVVEWPITQNGFPYHDNYKSERNITPEWFMDKKLAKVRLLIFFHNRECRYYLSKFKTMDEYQYRLSVLIERIKTTGAIV